jgi:hypothetical protein
LSWVQNVIVAAARQDAGNVEDFATWLRTKPGRYLRRRDFPGVDFGREADLGVPPWPYSGDLAETRKDAWPGPKVRECHVWLGVLNGGDLALVRQHFAAIPWNNPNSAQLLIQDQEEFFFRLWMIRDGRLQEYAPERPQENDQGL